MSRLFSIASIIFLISCNSTTKDNNKKVPSDSTSRIDNPRVREVSGCFMRVLDRDTLTVHLEQSGSHVTGKLTFDNYQKDGSSGNVHGSIEGDLVRLVYRFQSEGMQSVSEVYFKIVDNGLIHGIGNVETRGDSSYFTDIGNISFENREKLNRVNCNDLPAKFRK